MKITRLLFVLLLPLIAHCGSAPQTVIIAPTIAPEPRTAIAAPVPITPLTVPIGTLIREKDRVEHGRTINSLEPVAATDDLRDGDAVRVRQGGTALLSFADQWWVRVWTDSDLNRIVVDRATDTSHEAGAYLEDGGLTGEVTGSKLVYTTPNKAVITILGTQFFIAYNSTQAVTTVVNFKGTVEVMGSGVTMDVPDGTFVEVRLGVSPTVPISLPPGSATLDRFEARIAALASVQDAVAELTLTSTPTPTPTSTATPTPAPAAAPTLPATPTPVPTRTEPSPTPTPTPAPTESPPTPTFTPTPTSTPTPTPTPTPMSTPFELHLVQTNPQVLGIGSACPSDAPQSVIVEVSVTGGNGVRQLIANWQLGDSSGTVSFIQISRQTYRAEIAAPEQPGVLQIWVVAEDLNGNRAELPAIEIRVEICPDTDPPTLTLINVTAPTIWTGECIASQPEITHIIFTVQDNVGWSQIVVAWRFVDTSGVAPISQLDDITFDAEIGPMGRNGSVEIVIRALDAAGNQAELPPIIVPVRNCIS